MSKFNWPKIFGGLTDEERDEAILHAMGESKPVVAEVQTATKEVTPVENPVNTNTAEAEKIAALEAQNATLAEQLKQFSAQQEKDRMESLKSKSDSWADALVKDSKIAPAQRDELAAFHLALSQSDIVVKSGESEVSAADYFATTMESRPGHGWTEEVAAASANLFANRAQTPTHNNAAGSNGGNLLPQADIDEMVNIAVG